MKVPAWPVAKKVVAKSPLILQTKLLSSFLAPLRVDLEPRKGNFQRLKLLHSPPQKVVELLPIVRLFVAVHLLL